VPFRVNAALPRPIAFGTTPGRKRSSGGWQERALRAADP
jgi:hypothetical protein